MFGCWKAPDCVWSMTWSQPQKALSAEAIHAVTGAAAYLGENERTSVLLHPEKAPDNFCTSKNTLRCFPGTFVSVTSYPSFCSDKAHLGGFHAPKLTSPPTQLPQHFIQATQSRSSGTATSAQLNNQVWGNSKTLWKQFCTNYPLGSCTHPLVS